MNTLTWIDPRCDRSGWPAGPWNDEPDKVQWRDAATSMPCVAKRASQFGHWCGYVGVAPTHPLHGKEYDDLDIAVHGGLTFAAGCQDGPPAQTVCHVPDAGEPEHLWWFGFDCAHCDDYSPYDAQRAKERPETFWRINGASQYRDLRYVQAQCANLARQLSQ
jgi:hypothetical protein